MVFLISGVLCPQRVEDGHSVVSRNYFKQQSCVAQSPPAVHCVVFGKVACTAEGDCATLIITMNLRDTTLAHPYVMPKGQVAL